MKKLSPLLIGLMIRAGIPTAFENDGGWKMDGDTPVFQDGNPVWIGLDGSEQIMKRDTVSTLRNEAKTWRTRAEENLAKLKDYDGLDAKQAREALEKIGKIDAKALIDAGEVDKVRDAVKTEYQGQISERDKAIGDLQGRVNGMITDAAFSNSEFIRENIAVPVEMFRAAFGKHFKIENDQLQAFDAAGNRLMSKKSIGEYAAFDEAIELLVEAYPHKDSILKAPDQRGTGSQGGASQRGTGRKIKRSEFFSLSPVKQAELAALMGKGELQIVD